MPQALTALIIKKIFNIPYVFTTHASDAEVLGKIPYFGEYFLNLIVSNSEKFTSVSINTEKKLKKFIKFKNWDNTKPLIVPMPVKDNIFEDCIEQKVGELVINNNLKFTYIGRFSEKKGVEKLIKSFSNTLNKNKNIELVICGSGYLKDNYLKLIASLGIQDNVTISDHFLNPSQLKYIYNISNFIVIPSIVAKDGDTEGLPVVLLESLYFGKVTLASTQSNAPEIIENKKNGFIFNSSNKNDLDELMEEILENKFDLNEIEENAKATGKRYISENIAKIHYDHLF
jgi:glycosyltransferase involved in cell wall biosynthesis